MSPRTALRVIWRWWLRISFVVMVFVSAFVLLAGLIFGEWHSVLLGLVGLIMCANGLWVWKRGEL